WYPDPATNGSFSFDETHGLIPGRSYTFFVKDKAGCIRQSDETTLYDDDLQGSIPILISAETTPACSGTNNGAITFTLDGSNFESNVDISWELFDLNDQVHPVQTSEGDVAWPSSDEITVEGLA